MITGITCFTNTSIFSGLNNINDINFDGISPPKEGHTSELAFERTLFIVSHILGFDVYAEQYTSYSRIDLLIKNGKIYLYYRIKVG